MKNLYLYYAELCKEYDVTDYEFARRFSCLPFLHDFYVPEDETDVLQDENA